MPKQSNYAREAIGRQPNMGDAYHILSEILWFQGMTLGSPSVGEARRLVEESLAAAEKAISLGSNAHATYALLLFTLKGDAGIAEREYKRAIDLQPNKSSVHGHYGVFPRVAGSLRGSADGAVARRRTGSDRRVRNQHRRGVPDVLQGLAIGRAILANGVGNRSELRARAYLLETVYFYEHKIPEMLSLVESSTRTPAKKRRKFAAYLTMVAKPDTGNGCCSGY